ncbi:MAG TPA: ORF6N domain-containing protein [Candidatus Udaeobacter sp.]
MPKPSTKLTTDQLGQLIYEVRGERVMLDSDLASIYGVETKTLKRAVKRNLDRFPKDFVFQLSKNEWKNLRYQIGASSLGRAAPMRSSSAV